MQRVYITGIGVVSPVGNNRRDFWEAIKAGRSGIRTLENLDLDRLPGMALQFPGDVIEPALEGKQGLQQAQHGQDLALQPP